MKNVLIAISIGLLGFAGYKIYQMQHQKALVKADNDLKDQADVKAKHLAGKIALLEIEQPVNDMAALWPDGTIQCFDDAGVSQNSTLYHFVKQ